MSDRLNLTRCPRPFDTEGGRDARDAAPWARGEAAELIAGAGGSSPYLRGLILREAEWLEAALDAPEAALDALLSVAGDDPEGDPRTALRQAKRRVALLAALMDLGGAWTLDEVTGALTGFADRATAWAMRWAVAQEIRRGKLPGQGPEDIASAGGLVALAMGKMGAGELNYSSDIDLICLFDETRYDRDAYHEARASLIRATRKMSQALSEMTAEGYVFRTDLRLRPDPAVTPVAMPMEAAERYYESLGRTWERAAYVKARAAAGDIAAGERFLADLTPFVWRKHLDFAAIRDAHDMRLRYREHKGTGGPITLSGHDMKLGRGGIREIEFFTQTRQIIAGGRDPDLRVRQTVTGLSVLAEKGWIAPETARALTDHYRAHREVEHRVQMVADAQTHALPQTDEGFERLACLMGRDLAELKQDLRARLEEVHALTEEFFAPDSPRQSAEPAPEFGAQITARWPSYAALRSARALDIFQRLRPEILARLQEAAQPDEALLAFDGFLEGLPAGVQLFSLFEANPQLIDLLVDIVSVSPDLARYLSRNAGVFDAVIGGDFFAAWPGPEALTDALARRLSREDDYERQLDATRRWGKEWHFRTGVHLLRGLSGPDEAGRHYAEIATASLAGLFPEVVAEFARKHGAPPGRGAAVLGMGSLGAGHLHARSDLDVIVIYDADGVEASEGRRPLPARTYYARLTQALVAAMTAPMAEGRLYEMDMRLRPSGNQGPVATSLQSFRAYQAEEAWTWEHLALTRARIVAGSESVGADVDAVRRDVLAKPHDAATVLGEVAKMRARIAAAKGEGGAWETKIGRGRMQEIELFAQAGALLSQQAQTRSTPDGIAAAEQCGLLDERGAKTLRDTYLRLRALQMGAKLIADGAIDPDTLGAGGASLLCRLTGTPDLDTLGKTLAEDTEAAGRCLDTILPEPEESA
ncbi:[protein-PII] uridylyltransferase family protein [Litorisediminicola beolgyonensis]|uniref:Glutamine-synthetase adenylyltransferase n=1 Tax=Litorisediminicola beolgyonensis TaxID=1173614 RepID=A0ABW3ZGY8_9RHOB